MLIQTKTEKTNNHKMIKKLIYKLDRPARLLLAAYDMRKVDIILFASRILSITAP